MFKIGDLFDNLEVRPGLQEHLLLHRDEYMVIDGDSKGKDGHSSSSVQHAPQNQKNEHTKAHKAPLLTLDETVQLEEESSPYQRTSSMRSDASLSQVL